MTTLLLEALKDADSLNSVANASGVQKSSIVRFVNGQQTLRLDMAERLAEHFGIECIRRKAR
jgi:plasmid maintenance system antidote protein VapI